MKSLFLKYCTVFVILFWYGCSSESTTTEERPAPPATAVALETLWSNTYGGTENEEAQEIITTRDGGLAILGTTKSIDGDITDHESTNDDVWLFKINTAGTLLWSRTYGGSDEDQGQDLIETADGGFLVVGFTRSTDGDVSRNAGFHDQWVLKLDATGVLEWEKSFGFSGTDQAFSVVSTSDGGFFVTGFLDVSASEGEGNTGKGASTAHGVGEFWGHRLDASGNVIWSRFFGGTSNDRSFDVLQTNDDAFLMVGASESTDFDVSNSQGSYDFWVVKVANTGELLWEKSFGGSGIDIAYSAVRVNDGFIIVGDTRSTDGDITNNNGEADFWIVKIDVEGNLVWEQSYGGTDFESARAIKPLNDGNFLVAGSSRSSDGDVSENNGENDFWIIKINGEGSLLWEQSFGGSEIDFSRDIVETNEGTFIIAGESESADSEIDNKGNKDVLLLNTREL